MITIRTTREIHVESFVDSINEWAMPELFELYRIFGYDIVYRGIEDALSCEEIDEEDAPEDILKDYWVIIVKFCCDKSGKKIPLSKLYDLCLDEEDCNLYKIPFVDDKDEDGNEVIFVDEPKEQMKFFPEMEKGLPPYRLRIVKKKVA